MTPASPRLLLVGCGDIATRLASLLEQDTCLTGLRRNPRNLPPAIEPLAADLCDAASLAAVLQGREFDEVVITLTPGQRTEQRYRTVYVEGTRHLLKALQGAPRLLFVSSTSVYAQDDGAWVDEYSEASGSGFAGRCLLEAEALVHDSGLPSSCVRFSGIYGPGRERLLRLVRDGAVDPAQAAQWSNRIHADDGARVLEHLLRRWRSGNSPSPCYIASDGCPARLGDVWQWLAAELGRPDPLADHDWRGQVASGKRCSSLRLQEEGFCFLYPDFRAGYRPLLASV